MIKVAVLKRYQKFWIKKSAKKDGEVASYEELSTLRALCEELLNDSDRKLIEAIMMDDLMERIVDDDEAATYIRLVAELQDKKSWFMVNSYLNDGSTPLHVVASKGFSDCVLAMIRKGANPNAIHSQLGHSVLHVAAMSGSHKTLNCLLANGANRCFVNTQSGRMRTALHYAAERGSSPCLLLLLNPSQGSLIQRNEEMKAVRGILDMQDSFGNTALHLACVDGSEECVRMLIEAGANVMVRNAEGKSVVDVARLMNSVTITNNNNTTTSSSGVTVGAILFMVLMAAGLDPMTETRIADKTPESSNNMSSNNSIEEISLLDGPASSSETEPLFVIINDGNLHSSVAGVHSAKVSKRLKFVRRSLYDSREDLENSSINGNMDSPPAPAISGIGAINIKKVEVFKSREEAEQRIHICFGKKSNLSEPVSPLRPAMQRKVWGNSVNIGSSSGKSVVVNAAPVPTVANNMSLVDTATIQSVTGDSTLPANTYYTARIDTTKIDLFLSTVPYFYPDASAIISTIANIGSAIEEEDPLWASYKRKHIRVSQINMHSTTAAYGKDGAQYMKENTHLETGAYFDTSMSNKPIKLSPHKPSIVVPAAATPASTSNNAEVFEMMCRMEELQQQPKASIHLSSQSEDNATPIKHPMLPATPNDETKSPPSPSSGYAQPPLLLDLPTLSIILPAVAAFDVAQNTEEPHTRFSPVQSSQQAENNVFAASDNGFKEESPMPASFVSPALRSPDLLAIHHFHHHNQEKENNHVSMESTENEEEALEEAVADPMEGCELNLASIDSTSTDDAITVSNDDETQLCSPDSNNNIIIMQNSPTESESEIEAKANRRLSVSERVAAVEMAIITSSSASAVVIPVPPPIAAVVHRRGSSTRNSDNLNHTLIPEENITT